MPITFRRRSLGPTEPKRKPERKFSVCLTVQELQGLPSQDEGSDAALVVDVKWKGPKAGMLFSRRSMKRGRTSLQPASETITWNEEFHYECLLLPSGKTSGQQKELSFQPWDVHFAVRKAVGGSMEKLSEIGTAHVDLGSFAALGEACKRTDLFTLVPFHSGSDLQAVLKVTIQLTDISEDAEPMEGAQPALFTGSVSDATLASSSVGQSNSVRKDKSSASDEEDDEDILEEAREKVAAEKGFKKAGSMGKLGFASLLAKSRLVHKEETNSQRLFDALDLSMTSPMFGGEETEEEDQGVDDSLRYGRIIGVNLAVHNSLPSVPPLLPLSGSESEESLTTSPASPRSTEAASTSGETRIATAGGPALGRQASRRFLGLSFGSSSKPSTPAELSSSATMQQQEEADELSDTEDAPEAAARPGAGGLQIRVPGAVTGFSDWGASVWGGKRKMASRSPKAMEEPLLNKAYGEEGGDEIDWDRRQAEEAELGHPLHQQKLSRKEKSEFDEDLLSSIFGEVFSVGRWENREITSRDSMAKLRTDVFFASIDQCHERAAGEGACTALVAMVAEWLHAHPHAMPNKAEFDSIIKEGSAEWRRLCEIEAYKARFADKHFDLETVVEARSGRLQVASERSYIGFFRPQSGAEKLSFLDGAMSFDNILEEVEKAGPAVYILSWNDHFFVLVVETDKCFIVDTLGERLYEGCRQAYILRFDANSTISRAEPPPAASSQTPKGKAAGLAVPGTKPEVDEKATEKVSEAIESGKEEGEIKPALDDIADDNGTSRLEAPIKRTAISLCGQFVKEFFAGVPLRELEKDVEKGLTGSAPLHQRLQVEFHFTLPGKSPEGYE